MIICLRIIRHRCIASTRFNTSVASPRAYFDERSATWQYYPSTISVQNLHRICRSRHLNRCKCVAYFNRVRETIICPGMMKFSARMPCVLTILSSARGEAPWPIGEKLAVTRGERRHDIVTTILPRVTRRPVADWPRRPFRLVSREM